MSRLGNRVSWVVARRASRARYLTELVMPHLGGHVSIVSDAIGGDFPHVLAPVLRGTIPCYHVEEAEIAVVRGAIGLYPGMVVFHDVELSSHGGEAFWGSPWEDLVTPLATGAGLDSLPSLEIARAPRGPFVHRESALAVGAVATTDRCALELARCTERGVWRTGNRIRQIPVAVSPKLFHRSLPSRSDLIVWFGSSRREHRAYKVLQALSGLARESLTVRWCLAPSEEQGAREALAATELPEGITVQIVPLASPFDFEGALQGASLALMPSTTVLGGGLSPFVDIAFAAGVPVVGSKGGELDALPVEVCTRVPPGVEEGTILRECIVARTDHHLVSQREVAREWVGERSLPHVVATGYRDLFEQWGDAVCEVSERHERLLARGGAELSRRGEESLFPPDALSRWAQQELHLIPFGSVAQESTRVP